MSDGLAPAVSVPKKRAGPAVFFKRLLKEKPLGVASGLIVLFLIFIAIFGDAMSPYPYDEQHLIDRLQGSSARYPLGTDQLGRDFLSRVLYGAQISVLVGLAVTTINVVLSTLIGGISGFFGGKLDIIVQRFVDTWICFPQLLLLLTIMSIVGRGLAQIVFVLGISGGISGARLIRSAVIGVKENIYFEAAKAYGSSRLRTFFRHVLPNIMPVIIISFSMRIGGVILTLASLGFLGYGLPPEYPDWGGLLSREGRKFMELAPHLALWPGIALTVTVWSLNMFGDAVRDLLDPRLRGGVGSYSGKKKKKGILGRLKKQPAVTP